jgi:hypothetical protein
VFAFSTADVVVFGARLAFLVDLLRDQKLTARRALQQPGAVAAVRQRDRNSTAR